MGDWKRKQCCGTCYWWHRETATNKNGAVRGDVPALCLVSIRWPASVPPVFRTASPGHTRRDQGDRCLYYQEREDA